MNDTDPTDTQIHVAGKLYTTTPAFEKALEANWVNDTLPVTEQINNDYHPETWHVTHRSDVPGLDREWHIRRVPTAASTPDLHALTYTPNDADEDGVVVERVGYLILHPYKMHETRVKEPSERIKADEPTDEQFEAIQNAFIQRAADVFWNHRDHVTFDATDACLFEPDDIVDVFRDANETRDIGLTDDQLRGLRQRHLYARPKGSGIAGGNDYRIRLAFLEIPAFELHAVQLTGHDTTAEDRETARRIMLKTTGVDQDIARKETVIDE